MLSTLWKTARTLLRKSNTELLCDPANPLLGLPSRERKAEEVPDHHVHSSTARDSPTVGTAQASIHGGRGAQKGSHTCNAGSRGLEREGDAASS